MDYLVVLQLITILSVLVYGVNIGLSIGLANLSKKVISLICVLYGGSVFLLGTFVSSYANIILEFISFNSMFSNLALATILIIAGILTIREWRLHDNNTIVSILLSTVVPYICFMISLMFLNTSLSSLVDLNSVKVKGIMYLFLIIIILLTYFISKHSKISKKPYQIVLGNYMITLGAYYLVSTLISPNMMIMRSEKLAAITISSPIALLSVVFLVIVMIAVGVMLNREDNIYR